MEEPPRTPASPNVVQEPDDVPDAAASDLHEERAAPSSTIAGIWIFVGLIGLWLLFSPAAIEYGAGDSTANTIIVGALALGVALAGITRLAGRILDFATLLLGFWLAASAAFLAESSSVRVNMVLMGGALVVLAIVSMSAFSDRGRAAR
jgi:hypothetical protein